jgi:hypothetical protein
MSARLALVLALATTVAGRSFVPALNTLLKAKGDTVVATVACCGSERPAVGAALSVPAADAASWVEAPTPIALLNLAGASDADCSVAAAACDVLAFEVRLDDLAGRTPHGLARLLPVLRRAVRAHSLHPQKKLLLVAVTEHDAAQASEADVSRFVAAEVDAMLGALPLPEGVSSAEGLLQVRCVFLPSQARDAAAYERALDSLQTSLTAEGDPGYFFAGGARTGTASSALACVGKAAQLAPPAAAQSSPAEVHAAFQCGLLAEAAARDFQKGAAELKSTVDSGALMADFGDTASALLADALACFDADAEGLGAAAPVAAARAALLEQLQRALYAPYRKQLGALQRQTLSKFRAKLAALKPSAEVEDVLREMRRDAMAGFDAAAAALRPLGVGWECAYERAAVVETMGETAKAHVETLMVQGLYLAKEGHAFPVDFSAHWLLPHPFGRDSRYDPVSTRDAPAYRPGKAAPMKLRATKGYRPKTKLKDPKQMIFTDKMTQ